VACSPRASRQPNSSQLSGGQGSGSCVHRTEACAACPGCFGTTVSCIGVGFSRTFTSALVFRMMAGRSTENVGWWMRTMISEIIKEKKFQSRAFSAASYVFQYRSSDRSNFGRLSGRSHRELSWRIRRQLDSWWKAWRGLDETFPYALPNLVSAVFITGPRLSVILGLD